ncbi:MAG: hypothetical protein B9S32_01035 [Verrucomicrobia bacterium Tous-C9LFEB]|nr:MAG: hypothetical protein B9S32_01035 [Verrucomicrobia bacterium Tous-C9LFEB]
MSEDDYAPNQLRKAGIPPAGIKYVIISYLHSDHVGALDSFPSALHFIQRSELEYADNKQAVERLGLKLHILEGEDYYEVFGDDSIKNIIHARSRPRTSIVVAWFPAGQKNFVGRR